MFEVIEREKNSDMLALSDGNVYITYKQLYKILMYNQKYLQKCGYKAGDHIIIYADSQFNFVVVALSMLSLGTWIVPVNKIVNSRELLRISEATDARIMKKEEMRKCVESYEFVSEGILERPDERNCGVFHMTSGSTGAAKFCIRSLNDFMLESRSFQEIFGYKRGHKILSLCPLEHSFAAGAAFFNSFNFGGTLYVVETFNPKKVLKFIQLHFINSLIMVPSMLRVFNNLKISSSIDSLEHILVGAGIMNVNDVNMFENKYGCHVYSNYGSSESGCVITSGKKWVSGSVGVAMPGVTLKICDNDYNIVENGLLYIKCSWFFSGYYGENDNIFTEDGYITLGDIGRIDNDGNVFIEGRKGNMVKVNGRTINCLVVERALMELPYVKDCKVVGCSKKNDDKYLKAFVVAEKIDIITIRRELHSLLDDYQIPESIELVTSIPRNSMGKVLVNELL